MPLSRGILGRACKKTDFDDVIPAFDIFKTDKDGHLIWCATAVTFEDAVREAPNVRAFKWARSVSALEVSMRGQTAIPSSIVYDPAVGLYIDGV